MKKFLLVFAAFALVSWSAFGQGAIPGLATTDATPATSIDLPAFFQPQPRFSSEILRRQRSEYFKQAVKEYPDMANPNSELYRLVGNLTKQVSDEPWNPLCLKAQRDPDGPYILTVTGAKLLEQQKAAQRSKSERDAASLKEAEAKKKKLEQLMASAPPLGSFVLAVSDEPNVPSNIEGWNVDTGEVYKFQGFTETGLAVLQIGSATINAHWQNFVVIPQKDIMSAAVKFAEEVKQIKKDDRTSAEWLQDHPKRTHRLAYLKPHAAI